VKVHLRTFGCRANQYDSEAVRAMLEAAGHTLTSAPGDADVALFNSCAVTAQAEADLRKAIRRAAREAPALRSVVMGCAAALDEERPTESRLRTLPTVDAVVAGADLPAIAEALGIPPTLALRTRHQSGARALLRIQDGCDEHCTFCATTMARGANRSRPPVELLREAQALATHHPEIVITGIHIGSYGTDIGSSLGLLIERLVREVPSVRFRLSSLEATEVDERLFDLLTGAPRQVTPHLHAPLQSGSDRLLRRMGRHWYTAGQYAMTIERLAERCGAFGLGADIITGFPGERPADHEQTLALVERLPFTYLHVFPYSPRPGTAAVRLPDPVAPALADRRAGELRALADAKASAYADRRGGGDADVVVIGGADGQRSGLTGDYLTVQLADRTAPRGTRFAGRLERTGETLVATPAADPRPAARA
jgi:threonylcarbamoyladenosine tRNA methylthiotransferase MtaB